MTEMLVLCPRCGGCAVCQTQKSDQNKGVWESRIVFVPERITCSECGTIKDFEPWAETAARTDEERKRHYRHELWLKAECCGHTLWALSEEHLDALEAFIAGGARKHQDDPWRERERLHSLPVWMKTPRHRDAVLGTLRELRQRIPEHLQRKR